MGGESSGCKLAMIIAVVLVMILSFHANTLAEKENYRKIVPANSRNSEDLVGLLEQHIQTKDLQGAEKIAERLFSKDPYTLSVFGDIMVIYLKNGCGDELPKFFKRMEIKYEKDEKAIMNLWICKAFYYRFLKDWDQAKQCYIEAKKRFEKWQNEYPDLYNQIDREIQQMDTEIEFEKAIGKRHE